MKLLIAGSPSKIFHLREFGEELTRQGHEYKLVLDTDIYTGFPSKEIKKWFESEKKFEELISEFSPDVVFVDRQANFGKIVIKKNIPLLVHLRGDHWSELEMAKKTLYKYPPKRSVIWFKEQTANKCFEGAEKIFPICKHLEKVVKKRYPNKTTSVLYQGIKPNNWFKTDGMQLKHPCVGLVQGAVIFEKTKELLTLTSVLEKMPHVTFYWAGDGPYRNEVLPILEKYDNFEWLGALEYPNKIRDFLSEIDVYALLSGIDMAPLTLLEAQLMEKPVIATSVGGIPELMINKKSGFLIEKGDPVELIKDLEIIFNNSEKSKEMGKVGRKFVIDNFSWEIIVKKFVSDIKDLIK
jgi:glycosyltransferase involved in cell wall biosynthesis